jgi:hypothetical protein
MLQPHNPLDGDLDAARHRLRDLAGAACQALDAETLNVLSFILASYVDNTAGNVVFTSRMRAEIKAEQQVAQGEW